MAKLFRKAKKICDALDLVPLSKIENVERAIAHAVGP